MFLSKSMQINLELDSFGPFDWVTWKLTRPWSSLDATKRRSGFSPPNSPGIKGIVHFIFIFRWNYSHFLSASKAFAVDIIVLT